MTVYDIGHNMLDHLCAEIKLGVVRTERCFGDKDASICYGQNKQGVSHTTDVAIRYANSQGIYLSHSQVAAMNVPNSPKSLELYSWMAFYFDLVGDQEPNLNGEIHLEPTDIKDIHREYCFDIDLSGGNPLDITQFCNMWRSCFR